MMLLRLLLLLFVLLRHHLPPPLCRRFLFRRGGFLPRRFNLFFLNGGGRLQVSIEFPIRFSRHSGGDLPQPSQLQSQLRGLLPLRGHHVLRNVTQPEELRLGLEYPLTDQLVQSSARGAAALAGPSRFRVVDDVDLPLRDVCEQSDVCDRAAHISEPAWPNWPRYSLLFPKRVRVRCGDFAKSGARVAAEGRAVRGRERAEDCLPDCLALPDSQGKPDYPEEWERVEDRSNVRGLRGDDVGDVLGDVAHGEIRDRNPDKPGEEQPHDDQDYGRNCLLRGHPKDESVQQKQEDSNHSIERRRYGNQFLF